MIIFFIVLGLLLTNSDFFLLGPLKRGIADICPVHGGIGPTYGRRIALICHMWCDLFC